MSDTPTTIRSHYECPVCEFDDVEAGTGPWPPGDYWCPLCAEDNGRDVLMRCTRIAEDAQPVNVAAAAKAR